MFRTLLILTTTILAFFASCTRTDYTPPQAHAPFLNGPSTWADSVLLQMSVEEKAGQLLAWSVVAPDQQVQSRIWSLAEKGKLSGLRLNQMPLKEYAALIDSAQSLANVPLLNIGNQRVAPDNTFSDQQPYPSAATIAALHDDTVEYHLRQAYLLKAQALQLDMVVGPELHPTGLEDTVFNQNAGRQHPDIFSKIAMDELSDFKANGILSFANGFRDLVFVENDTMGVLDSVLFKYNVLVKNGLSGLVVDTLLVGGVDNDKRPKNYLRQYVNRHLQFDGILMGMVRDTQLFKSMIHAGVDFFMVNGDVEKFHALLVRMVQEGHFAEKDLNTKVYKILMAKAWKKDPAAPTRIEADQIPELFDDPTASAAIDRYHRKSVVLANNPDGLLPLKQSALQQLQIVQVGKNNHGDFNQNIKPYAVSKNHHFIDDGKVMGPLRTRWQKKPVIVVLNDFKLDTLRHQAFMHSVNEHAKTAPTVLVNIGHPLNLRYIRPSVAVVQGFENNPVVRGQIAAVITGAATTHGKLPLTISPDFAYGAGECGSVTRLAYARPQDVGINPVKLVGVDALMNGAIKKGATPGGQIMLIKDGKVFYHKAFGHHQYDRKKRVQLDDLYDIASLTKVAATTLATMKLYENEQVKLGHRLSQYLPLTGNKSLGRLTLKRLLTHQSGLQSNMPVADYILYEDTLHRHCNAYYCKTKTGDYTIQIADSMFMHQKWRDSMWQEVMAITPKRRKRFLYSDVNFNLLQKVVETQTRQPFDDYLYRTFYRPLGLRHLTYNPRERHAPSRLVPTAQDDRWRQQQLHGFVHDESAALLGGVAGNAGLFANANDLGVLFQMLLNGGTYGGDTLLQAETIQYFTSARHGNHRGLGFDTKTRRRPPSCGKKASRKTYGHTGFTGTCVWVDPDEELIFIFLSNRIAPDVKNKKLFKSKLRSRIHDVVYGALDTHDIPEMEAECREVAEFVANN